MASGFFAILDDIAALMDDVAVASKLATKKTAGILGDDLAVNAEKATGFLASRELPVLWAITKGSFLNKIIIIPILFLLQWIYEPAIRFILIIGGCYLAYEGMEKIFHFVFHRNDPKVLETKDTEVAPQVAEKSKIKAAITTDFILSIEIVIIALGTVLDQPLHVQIATVAIVAILATIGVYGIVALIVRMDDAGFKLIRKSKGNNFLKQIGRSLVQALPVVIKLLGIIGTVALLMVSGGIFAHYIEFFHHLFEQIPSVLKEMLLGIIVGTVIVGVVELIKKITKK